jgi:flagellar basal-body rod protein FlgB
MSPIGLFKVASQHNQWLSMRQSIISGNVANANTPGYKAREIEPFEAALSQAGLGMAQTQAGHIAPPADTVAARTARDEDTWQVQHSGGTVTLEAELMKAGEVNRAYAMNTGVIKAFHRMLIASAKG